MSYRVQNHRRAMTAGVTLIELLLVMVILAFLAAIVVPKFTGRTQQANVTKATSDLHSIKLGIDAFEIDNSRLPTAQEGIGALVNKPSNDLTNWHKFFDAVPTDPWQHDYVYRVPGTDGRAYDLVCCGPDGQVGGGDDIGPQ